VSVEKRMCLPAPGRYRATVTVGEGPPRAAIAAIGGGGDPAGVNDLVVAVGPGSGEPAIVRLLDRLGGMTHAAAGDGGR
jgi:hypothetical protein